MFSFTISFALVFSHFKTVCMFACDFCIYISVVPQTERVDKPTLGMTPSQQVHTESFYLHSGCKQERTEKSSEILTQKLTKHRYSILLLVSLFRFHPLLVFVLLFISCQNFFLPITATWRAVENRKWLTRIQNSSELFHSQLLHL